MSIIGKNLPSPTPAVHNQQLLTCSVGPKTTQSDGARTGGHSVVLLRPVLEASLTPVLRDHITNSRSIICYFGSSHLISERLAAWQSDRAAVWWEKDLPDSAESSRTQPDLLSRNQNAANNLKSKL